MKPQTHGLPATLNAGEKVRHPNLSAQLHNLTKRLARLLPRCYFLAIALFSLFIFGFLVWSVYREVTWLNAVALGIYALFFLLALLLTIMLAAIRKRM